MSDRINQLGITVAFTVLLAAISWSEGARAQDPETTASARALFDEGVTLADRGEWETAADRFRRSQALRPSPVVAFNLARADVQIGRLVEASELLRPITRDDGAQPRLRDAASALLTEITPRIARLRVELSGDRRDATIAVDGRPLPDAAIGVDRPTDPGDRVITATRGDAEIASARVTLAPGASESVSLELPPRPDIVHVATPTEAAQAATAGAGPASGPSNRDDEGGSALPWILVGAGAAVAIAATVIVILLVGNGGTANPVSGNLQPGIIEFGG